MRLSALLLVAACSACASSAVSEPRTARAETELARALAGKIARPSVDCLPSFRANDMAIIDDNTILFRDGSRRVYRNDPPGGCSPMGRGNYTLVTRSSTGEMCRGDIVRVVDLSSRMIAGSCSLGDFVPYEAVTGRT